MVANCISFFKKIKYLYKQALLILQFGYNILRIELISIKLKKQHLPGLTIQ